MPLDSAAIILRADIIQPKIVPPAIVATYDRLVNHVIPELGVEVYVEFFETGWLLFFATTGDFRTFYTYYKQPTNQASGNSEDGKTANQEAPIIWDMTFLRLPIHSPEEVFAKILERYHMRASKFGESTFKVLTNPKSPIRYRIKGPSVRAFVQSAEDYVAAAHKVLMAKRKYDAQIQ